MAFTNRMTSFKPTRLVAQDPAGAQPRRDFVRLTLGAAGLGCLGIGAPPASAASRKLPPRNELLKKLEALKAQDDPMFPVGRAETDLVYMLACLRRAKSILEIGTAHGYWTIWLALAAMQFGGKVTTIEIKPERRQKAIQHLTELGVAKPVTFLEGNAHEVVAQLKGAYDLVVLNADKSGMMDYFNKLYPKRLKPGGLLLVYNYLTRREDMKDYITMIQAHPGFVSAVVGAIPDDAFLASLDGREIR